MVRSTYGYMTKIRLNIGGKNYFNFRFLVNNIEIIFTKLKECIRYESNQFRLLGMKQVKFSVKIKIPPTHSLFSHGCYNLGRSSKLVNI